jgi:hypothetical protein
MTTILSNDCATIDIDSEFLLADNQTNVLTVTHNGVTIYTPTISASATTIVLNNTLLGLTGDALADGVYYLELVTTALNGDINTETICVAVLCGVHCDMVELYTDVNNAEKILAYEALKVAQGCVTCSCATMLTLYSILTNVVTNGCGCE